MGMIRKACDQEVASKKMFNAPGELKIYQILKPEEFSQQGRLFNYCILKPGEGIGKHGHHGDFETYYILSGAGTYNDNGKDVILSAGDTAICYDGEEHSLLNTGLVDLTFVALIIFTKK